MLPQLDKGAYRYFYLELGHWKECSPPTFFYKKKNGVHVRRELKATNKVEEYNATTSPVKVS